MNDTLIKNYTEVGDAISLLSGAREPRFELEKALRLYQFKAWLLDTRQYKRFHRYGLVFLAVVIGINQAASTELKASEEIDLLFRKNELRPLIDYVFDGLYFEELIKVDRLHFQPKHVKADRHEIKLLNAFNRGRLRLYYTPNITPSRNNGLLLWEHLKDIAVDGNALTRIRDERNTSSDREYRDPGQTIIKRIRTSRRERESFLFAADDGFNKMLTLPNITNIIGHTKDECNDLEYLHGYFSYAKALVQILDKDAERVLKRYWPKLDASDNRQFNPVIEDDLDKAGIKRSVPRAAENTRKANRQAPPSGSA